MMTNALNVFLIFICFVRLLPAFNLRSKNPYIYLATTDVIILPEDYETDFLQPISTTDSMPGVDYNYDTETDTLPGVTYFEKIKSEIENERTTSTAERYDARRVRMSIEEYENEQWPLVVLYELNSSSTEYLKTLNLDYPSSSSSMKTWKSYFPTRSRIEYGHKIKYFATKTPKIYEYGEIANYTQYMETYSIILYFITRTPKINEEGEAVKNSVSQDTTWVPHIIGLTGLASPYYSDLQNFEKRTSEKRRYKNNYTIEIADDEMSLNREAYYKNPYFAEMDEFTRFNSTENVYHKEPAAKTLDNARTYPTSKLPNKKSYSLVMEEFGRIHSTEKAYHNYEPASEMLNYEKTYSKNKALTKKHYSQEMQDNRKLNFSEKPNFMETHILLKLPDKEMLYRKKIIGFGRTNPVENTSDKISNFVEMDHINTFYIKKKGSKEPVTEMPDYEETYPTNNSTYRTYYKIPYSIEMDEFKRYHLTEHANLESATEMLDYERTIPTENILFMKPFSTEMDELRRRYFIEKAYNKSALDHRIYTTENTHNEKRNFIEMYDFGKLTDPNKVITISDYEGPYTTKKATDYKQNLFTRQIMPLKKKLSNNSCYQCGISEHDMTELSTNECYQAFDNPTRSGKFRQKPFRTECHGDSYIGGCYKRFLDVGQTYNERGCRHIPPMVGVSFASKRFANLELVLHTIKDGCTTSPYASLVPLSRAVSLYSRFHVCVCNSKLCNNSSMKSGTPILFCNFLYLFIILK